MGSCDSSPDKAANKATNKDLKEDAKLDASVKKLLFLGSGGSGKSTLFKQLRTIHGAGYLDKDRLGFKDHIYSQVIEQSKLLLECYEDLREEFPEEWGAMSLSEAGTMASEYIGYIRGDMDVDEAVAENVETLWKEPAMKEIYANRANCTGIDDSSAHFFDQVRRIATRSYIPTDEDILLVRHRTTGVIEQKFTVKTTVFHVFDVGGQKSERKKWIHCFEHVTAVIFVCSLSCYDEVMFENDKKNAMADSLELFSEICNKRWFIGTAMILFLNKKDLFAQKIQTVPLSVCPMFEDYDGDNSYDETVGFVRRQYEERNDDPKEKQIYSHVTCATDKSNVEKVFGDVQHIVINTSLQRGGLI